MRIEAKLADISDGRLYDLNDMVKADTRGCHGCSACCHGMGDTIVLNPYDMWMIVRETGQSFDDLLDIRIELHMEEKVTLPNLKMTGADDACSFLGGDQRCSIHSARPGICRLFPLGRYYDGDDFKYIFKAGECVKPNLTKVKVKKWIDLPRYSDNKAFLLAWYKFLKALKWRVRFIHDDKERQQANDYLIEAFFREPWPEGVDFYEAFEARLAKAKDRLGLL